MARRIRRKVNRRRGGMRSMLGRRVGMVLPMVPKPMPAVMSMGLGRRRYRRHRGRGFFSNLWSGIKNTFSKPSRILGALSLIPSPLSGALRVAGTATGLAGHGRRKYRKRRIGGRRRAHRRVHRRVGRGLSTEPIY